MSFNPHLFAHFMMGIVYIAVLKVMGIVYIAILISFLIPLFINVIPDPHQYSNNQMNITWNRTWTKPPLAMLTNIRNFMLFSVIEKVFTYI